MKVWKKWMALPLMMLSFAAAADDLAGKQWRVGVVDHVYPFSYEDRKTGERVGFDVDITRAVCKELKLACQIVPLRYIDLLNTLQNGEIDMVVNGWRKIATRMEPFVFSDPYYRTQIIFISHEPVVDRITVDNINGKTVGTLVNSGQATILSETYLPVGAKMKTYQSNTELFDAIKHKEVDLIFVSGFEGYELLKQPSNHDLYIAGMHRNINVRHTGRRIALHPKHAEMVNDVNRALMAIKTDGTYQAINLRYFEFMVY